MEKHRQNNSPEVRETQYHQPGSEQKLQPPAKIVEADYKGSEKLKGKVALITGGDSGIGRAVAVLFAKEGADVMIGYLEEDEDAQETKQLVEQEGRYAELKKGDLRQEEECKKLVQETIKKFGKLDILVNNAAEQHLHQNPEDMCKELYNTFATNIFSYFYVTQAALAHLKEGSVIINTTSVTAYRGGADNIAYASTKGAIVAFTRSLSTALVERNIRVNAVAPGPIWTPLIPATFDEKKLKSFGSDVPMRRVGQPSEVAPCYVFLASSKDSSYFTGQVLHPNGGEIING